jgi:hypothetical protein
VAIRAFPDECSASVDSLAIDLVIWHDDDADLYRGLMRQISIFAQGDTPDATFDALIERASTYIEDVLHDGGTLNAALRPVSRYQWWSLIVRLTVRRIVSHLRRHKDGSLDTFARKVVHCPAG